MKRESKVLDTYFENVIKKSWTWERLTEEERKRFLSLDFSKISGKDVTRIEWYHSMYYAFLLGLGYEPIRWRETEENIPQF